MARSFGEPYSGTIRFDTPVRGADELDGHGARPAAGERRLHRLERRRDGPAGVRRKPGDERRDAGVRRRHARPARPARSPPTIDGISPTSTFTLPQNVAQVTAQATWTGADTLVDLGLYDPSQTDKSESLAPTSAGNTVVLVNPMAGLWTLIMGYGNPALPPADADYTIDVTTPRPLDRRVHRVRPPPTTRS